MTYGFVIFYRFKLMTKEEAKKAKTFWKDIPKDNWPKNLRVVGDYSYAWGSEWNGFFLVETEKVEMFFEFWPLFRNMTRWYIENTRTIIGRKTDLMTPID